MIATLPQNLDAEKQVLGSVLLSPSCHDRVRQVLTASHFYGTRHADVWRVMDDLSSRGQPISLSTVTSALAGRVQPGQLVELLEGVATAAAVDFHAQAVADAWLRRQIVEVFEQGLAAARDPETPGTVTLSESDQRLIDLEALGAAADKPRGIHEGLYAEYARVESGKRVEGIKTGVPVFDELTKGMIRKKLYVTAGRPGAGKTAIAMSRALAVAQRGHRAHFFSLEMDYDELMGRALSALAHVDGSHIMDANVEAGDSARLAEAVDRGKLPLTVDDQIRDIDRILARARMLARQGVEYFVVDWLGLIDTNRKFERDDLRLAHHCTALRDFAKRENVCVHLLAQFRKDDPGVLPHNGMLWGSSGIENNANVIELLHDPVAGGQVERLEHYNGLMMGLITKCRHFRIGRVLYRFERKFTTYRAWDGPEPIFLKGKP